MEKPFDVVVVGEINADLILRGEVVPVFGQVEQLVEDTSLTVGSSSAIFACGAARLGLRVAFVGKAGDDPFGRFMQAELVRRGVDTRGVVIDPDVKTGLSVIFSRENDRAILTFPGSIAALRYEDIDLALLGQAHHLHLGSYFLLESLQPDIPQLFRTAHSLGLSVSLDTNYDPARRWDGGLDEALQLADVFLPNETEALAITHAPHLKAALAFLPENLCVAVKLGAQGALARCRGKMARVETFPIRVIDTTGAGDSFDAGFIFGYLAGWDLEKTLRLACACGALSTRASGGVAAQATLTEALEAR